MELLEASDSEVDLFDTGQQLFKTLAVSLLLSSGVGDTHSKTPDLITKLDLSLFGRDGTGRISLKREIDRVGQ